MSNAITLTFVELDDFCQDLQEQGIKTVRVELQPEMGEPRKISSQMEIVNRSHTVNAVATALRPGPDGRDTVIVRWERQILVTDSLSMRMGNSAEDARSKMFANFEKVQAEFAGRGFTVKRGMWQ